MIRSCIIAIPLLFGLSLSQATDNARIDYSTYCTAHSFALDKIQYNVIILEKIKSAKDSFERLDATISTDVNFQGDIDTMVDFLDGVYTNPPPMAESIIYIKHLTDLINEDRSILYCEPLVNDIEKWTEWNLFVENVFHWALKKYFRVNDCLMDPHETNCSLTDGSSYLLFGALTTGQSDLLTFLQAYSSHRVKHYKVQHRFSLLSLMTKWFRSLQLKKSIAFSERTAKWLHHGHKMIESELHNIQSQIDDLNEDINNIDRLIGNVNSGSDEYTKLLEYSPTIVVTSQQLNLLIIFVEDSVAEMINHAEPLWETEFSEWIQHNGSIEATANPYRKYEKRERWRTLLTNADNAIDSAALLTMQLREAIRIAKTHKGKESAIFKRFNMMSDAFISYNTSATMYLQCFKEALNSSRAIFLPRKVNGKRIVPRKRSGYNNIELIIEKYKSYLTNVDHAMGRQISDLSQFQDYLDKLTVNENAAPPFFVGVLPDTEAINLFEDILESQKKFYYSLWYSRCELTKTLTFAEIFARLYLLSDERLEKLFFDDPTPVPVPEFLSSKLYGYTLFSLMDSHLSNDKDLFKDLEVIQISATYYCNRAFENFHGGDLDNNELQNLSYSISDLPRTLDHATRRHIRQSYEVVSYLCRVVMRKLLQYFPEISKMHRHVFDPETTMRGEPQPGPADRLIRVKTTASQENVYSLFDGDLDSITTLRRVENRSTVSGYTDNLGKLSVFNFGENNYLFEFPICEDFCTYRCEFSDTNARLAVGFGHLYVFSDDHAERLVTGTYLQTPSPLIENELYALLTLHSSNKVNIAYRDEYGRIGKGYYFSSAIDQPRLHVAVSGKLKFNCEELAVAIVEVPNDVRESPRYNVYEVTATPGFVQNVYVAKGVHKQMGGETSWFSLTNNSEPVNIAIGVSIPFTDQFHEIEISGYFFDGEKFVSNLLYASYNKLQPTYYAQCDVSDITINGICVEYDQTLYMSYQLTEIEDSSTEFQQYQTTLKFFSKDASYGYKFEIVQDIKLVPSYVVKKHDSILLKNPVEMRELETAPEGVPQEFRDVCMGDIDCKRKAGGDYCCEDRACDGMDKNVFGVCKDNMKQRRMKIGVGNLYPNIPISSRRHQYQAEDTNIKPNILN